VATVYILLVMRLHLVWCLSGLHGCSWSCAVSPDIARRLHLSVATIKQDAHQGQCCTCVYTQLSARQSQLPQLILGTNADILKLAFNIVNHAFQHLCVIACHTRRCSGRYSTDTTNSASRDHPSTFVHVLLLSTSTFAGLAGMCSATHRQA
jgi:hypothetical protein